MKRFRLFKRKRELKIFLILVTALFFSFYSFFEATQYVSLYLKTKDFKKMQDEGYYDEVILKLEDYFQSYEGGSSQFLRIYVDALFKKNLASLKNHEKIDHDKAFAFLNFVSYLRNNGYGNSDLNDYYAFVAYYRFKDFFYKHLEELFDSTRKKRNPYFEDEWTQQRFEEVFLEKGDFERALMINEGLLKKKPNDLYFQLQNAIILYEMGKGLESIDAFKKVVFAHDEYEEGVKEAMKRLIDISAKYSLTESIEYYYEYILERSNRDLFWLEEYRKYLKEKKVPVSKLSALNKEIKLKEKALGR